MRHCARTAVFGATPSVFCRHPENQGNSMYYIVESDKSFYEASVDLEEVILRLGFSLLHIHDLGAGLRGKDIDCDEEAKVFEVSSPRQTERLLAIDMRLNMALPLRISVFTENGATKIGVIRPAPMLAAMLQNAELARLASEIEEKMIQIVDEAR
jgi:uncharacterized protein (DUF302 family)